MSVYWETVSPAMGQVLDCFAASTIGSHFYLAGGTALALQLGHRRSIDLDYFSPTKDIPSVRQELANALGPSEPVLADSSWGNLVFIANGVRVGFYGYGYSLVEPLLVIERIRLAGVSDIALMKLDALLSRASRKDFHDLYAICQTQPLRQLLDLAPQKYPQARDFESQVVKRLVFFELADQEEAPSLLVNIPWEDVKTFFRQQAVILGKSWLS
jgi:hypothetical protein